jgi:hypothetical protein
MRLLTVPVAVMSLAMLVGSCAKPAPVEELPPPPRITWQKTQVATDRVDLPARKRGLRAVRGIIHLHSVYSHDACDGNPQPLGQPSAPCLRNLRKGLCATRQDFAMLTDHATHMGEAPWDKLFLTDPAAGDQTIREGGELVGGRMRCPDEAEQPGSHEVVITVGGENDLMPVGLHRHLGDTVAARKQAMGADTPEAVRAFHAAGGLVLQAHAESRELTKLCTLAAAGLDGMEVYNLHANLDPKIRETHLGLDGLAAFAGLAPWLESKPVAEGGPEPDLALLGFLEDNSKQRQHYHALLGAGYRLAPLFGSDIHENTFKGTMADGERGDSYRRLMRFFANYLLVPAGKLLLPSDLATALKQGRGFSVFEVMGQPQGFDFSAEKQDGSRAELGDTVDRGAKLTVRAPQPLPVGYATREVVETLRLYFVPAGGAEAEVVAEQKFTAEELQQGAGLSFDTALRGAGAYRVEARLIPRHLLHLLGDESTRYDKEYPYLFSGSIYVGNIARHGGRCQSVPLPP